MYSKNTRYVVLVYVIAWVAVVFGINCASNVGRKLVIVRGALLLFPAYITRAINSKYYGKPCYYNMFFLSHVIASDNLLGVCQQIRCITVF